VARNRLVLSLFLFSVVTGLGVPPSNAQPLEKMVNWTAPPYWAPAPPSSDNPEEGLSPEAVQAVPTAPLAFTGIPPCRVADTRGNGFSGQYGPPQIFTAGRTITIVNVCGIPATAQAVSFNFSAVNIPGAGFLVTYPAGGAFPPTATIVYNQNTPNLSNAAVVPLGTGGAITVVGGVVPIDLVIDVNGYYAPNIVTSINGSTGAVTIPVLPTGAFGETLRHDGISWVASNALRNDGTDISVSGVLRLPAFARATAGLSLLFHNTAAAGSENAFFGVDAGNLTTNGDGNNSGFGTSALHSITNGDDNTGMGHWALTSVQTGFQNTAVGSFALSQNTGSENIALGYGAGTNVTTGTNNMYLGNEGVAAESNTIRIGTGVFPAHTRMFVAGVASSTVTGTAVLISGTGQLGIATSSARFKEEIRDMAGASDRLLELRPVTFHYKGHAGDPLQYGLIAEEVEKVLPELVVKDPAGQPQTVLYHEMPAMLLNELQKQQRRIEAQDDEIATLRKRLGLLEERLAGDAAR